MEPLTGSLIFSHILPIRTRGYFQNQLFRSSAPLISAEDFDPLMDVFLLSRTVRKSRAEITEGKGIDHRTAMRQFRERHGI